MIDQLIIGDKASSDDFDASVAERTIGEAAKKEIKETVPFSNITYDFSAINGELYWEERELEYIFEIIASSPEELECKKMAFSSWIKNVMNEEIHDPFTPDFHYVGTFSGMSYDDDETMEKTTATVKFKAYPYKVANRAKNYSFSLTASEEITVTVLNDSSHRITPTFNSDIAFTVRIGDSSYSVPAGETTDESFKLAVGKNTLVLSATESGVVNISFCEEVF